MSEQFCAGRLKDFLAEWEKITNDPVILDTVQHFHVEFLNDNPPTQDSIPIQRFNRIEVEIIDSEIQKLLSQKVITEVKFEPDQFISPIFLRAKKNGEYRLILNLKKLNQHIPYQHFKMETFESAIGLVTKNMYFCSLDIRHAYYSVPLAEEQRKYFRFIWKGKIFQFCCMANGVSPGPRLFTKLMKPVYSKLRSEGHISSGFIDDSLLGGETYNECVINVQCTSSLMITLGFLINEEKSVLIPTRKICFLGNMIDSERMIVYLPDDKKEKIAVECKKLLNCNETSIRSVAKVTGLLVSSFSAVQYGKLFYRDLEKAKAMALKRSRGDYEALMYITKPMKIELKWWNQNVDCQIRHIDHGKPSMSIQTDSSTLGWGMVCDGQKAGGRWTNDEKKNHINVLELMAIHFALQSLSDKIMNKHVQILSDSSTAVCYVNNMGGVRSPACNDVSRKIWLLCMEKNAWVSCAHIPGKLNAADEPSRRFNDQLEWELDTDVYMRICSIWGKPTIDLFASRLNKKENCFCSWKPDPCAAFIDAFSINWSEYDCYIFPPFSLISRCIRKIQSDGTRATILVPLFTTQVWYPMLLKILVDRPVILPKTEKILSLPHKDGAHPLAKRMVMIACRVSGIHSEQEDFQNSLSEYSWHHGEHQLNRDTKRIYQDGFHSVVNGKLIPYRLL